MLNESSRVLIKFTKNPISDFITLISMWVRSTGYHLVDQGESRKQLETMATANIYYVGHKLSRMGAEPKLT